MKHKWIRITLYGGFVLSLVACNGAGAPTPLDETLAQPDDPPTVAANQIESDMPLSTPSSVMDALVEQAKEELAQQLSIPVNEIDLIEAEATTRPDASLGCPQAGMTYAQVVTPGYRILLEANGQVYAYYADSNKQLINCENFVLPTIPIKPGDIDDGQPWMPN